MGLGAARLVSGGGSRRLAPYAYTSSAGSSMGPAPSNQNDRTTESKSPAPPAATLTSQGPEPVTLKSYAPETPVVAELIVWPSVLRSSTWSPDAGDAARRTCPLTLGIGTRGPAPFCTSTP